MDRAATILILTHDHASTLLASVASAQAQTIADIEILVVGDGVPGETREIMARICAADDRVRFFDFPKGPRHGEIYRHAVLAEARGRIVCYLSDDDLYLPHHVESMAAALEDSDFANAVALRIAGDGGLSVWALDLARPVYQREMLAGRNRIPLSTGAHTLQAYRSLPEGWTSAPPQIPTDVLMWWKFLRHPGMRFRSSPDWSVLVFPALSRKGWTMDRRLEELRVWAGRVATPDGIAEVKDRMFQVKHREAIELDAKLLEALQDSRVSLHESVFQIFFPGPQGYSEDGSVRLPVRFGLWVDVDAEVPCDRADLGIRLDPADGPCLIQLRDLAVRAMDGRALWQAGGCLNQIRFDCVAGWICRGSDIGIWSDGNDPQVVLPVIVGLTPGERVRLTVKVRLEPVDAAPADPLAMSLRQMSARA